MNNNKKLSNILFVCIGNICRSPFAHGLFTKRVNQSGYEGLYAESAGLLALPGNSATHLAQKVAAEYGVDLVGHKAKPISQKLVDGSDLILVMEKSHKDTLIANFPEATDKAFLIRRFGRFGSQNRALPIHTGFNTRHTGFVFLILRMRLRGL